MTILSALGLIFLSFISAMLIGGALLNLGGCGDRIGDKYKTSNYLQIVMGILMAIFCWWLV